MGQVNLVIDEIAQHAIDCATSLLRHFELDRPPGLLLDHGGAIPHPASDVYVIDLQRDEIAAAQLAIDREIEQSEVALPTLQLKPDPNCPRHLSA